MVRGTIERHWFPARAHLISEIAAAKSRTAFRAMRRSSPDAEPI
jgi:hypothetical protein